MITKWVIIDRKGDWIFFPWFPQTKICTRNKYFLSVMKSRCEFDSYDQAKSKMPDNKRWELMAVRRVV